MDLLADSALVGSNTSSTAAIQGGVWNLIFGWSVLRRDFLYGNLRWKRRNDVWNSDGYWPWRVAWNRRSSRAAVSMQQCVMPILASETVVSACAIPELLEYCRAQVMELKLLDLDNIPYRKLVEIGFEKLAVWPAIIVIGTYLERFKPAGTKSKKTPGEESPKILKSGTKDQNMIVENRWSPKIEWYATTREYFGVSTRRAYMVIGSLGNEHYVSLT